MGDFTDIPERLKAISSTQYKCGILGNTTLAGLFESALNVGRLWQHVRTVTLNKLNDFEKI